MARLPLPPRPLPAPRARERLVLPAGSPLVRVYRIDPHGSAWDAFRSFGPTPRARFDHHMPPPGSATDRAILYAAGDGPTALVEAFAETRLIDRHDRRPWLVRFLTTRPLHLLDLRGTWPTRARASQALATGDHPARTQAWARAIHEDLPDLDGLVYPSSLRGRPPEPRPRGVARTLFGCNVALFERAADALPAHPSLHLALAHPGLVEVLAEVADRNAYLLV